MRNLMHALVVALSLAIVPVASQAGLFVGVSVNVAPPALPVYVQPPCPAPGYMWVPGYWAWDGGYYWVPGTWVLAPAVGLLWTPGYWGFAEGAYAWHAGYWGPHVGFYGGVNYGFGYTGVGYEGGYWRGGAFYYNRSVTAINTTNITNVYNRTVVNNVNVTRVSYNGGAGGIVAQPTRAQIAAEHERHLAATQIQRQQEQSAHDTPALRASANGGRPSIAATPKPGMFSGHGVVAAHGAPAHASQPAPEHYASTQPYSHAPAPASRAEPARSAPQYQLHAAPHYQSPAAPQGASRAMPGRPEHGKPEHGAAPEHGGEHNRQS
jgi:hypothetical protein